MVRWRGWNWLLVAAVVLLAGCTPKAEGGGESGGEHATTSGEQPAGEGGEGGSAAHEKISAEERDKVKAAIYGHAVSLVEKESHATVTVSFVREPKFSEVAKGGYYFVVHVAVKCMTGECEFEPDLLKAVGADDSAFEVEQGIVADELEKKTLHEGHVLAGDVAFRTDKGSRISETLYIDKAGKIRGRWES